MTYLSDRLQSTVWLQLVDTMTLGLAVGASLGDGALAATTADTNSVDDVSLLGTVSQTTSLVGASRSWRAVQLGQLTILPDTNAKQVTHNIALLLPVQFLHIPVGTHFQSSIDLVTNGRCYFSF